MEDSAAREDACREYQSSLEDLTFNSKPHINMLTILAEENIQFAKDIVAIIEAQISKAPASEKLPVLYLVDSIVKNVGGEYLAVFAKNLITSFICVFEKVDENTRKSLFKLRSTWDEVFPLKKLYALDVRVNSLDPAWPIKPLPPNVNSSIHVNPRFLKQSEEATSPPPAPVKPPPTTPVPQAAAPAINQSSLTQEQAIRQQLLAKQKQLLELQQKKIELELEQTKAQLGGLVMPPGSTGSTQQAPSTTLKPSAETVPMIRTVNPSFPQTGPKALRDPRLIPGRASTGVQYKDSPGKNPNPVGIPAPTPEKRAAEKLPRPDKHRPQRKEAEEKSKSKSPLTKPVPNKSKPLEPEVPKAPNPVMKDLLPKIRPLEKNREDEPKEKKRCGDKREEGLRVPEPPRSNKAKINGFMTKQVHEDSKIGGNARMYVRKRTRSRSRSPCSPKRKDRHSPHRPSKPRRIRTEEDKHSKPGREERAAPKKNQSLARRAKRPIEDRHLESRDSPRGHEGGKEGKDTPHRWRSGWEENKHPKLSEEPHMKPGPQRHKPYGTPTRPGTPRTPKHRLSVDANLQIPEVLNSASKKDLLRRASKRLESGEISQDDFLNMAHQINSFFQYQEEKQQQQRSESWDESSSFPAKKQPNLSASAQPRPHNTMDAAEQSYHEHKSKLKKTVNLRVAGEEGQKAPEDDVEDEKMGGAWNTGHPQPLPYSRAARDRQGERRSKEHEEPRPPLAPMIEEYNHGKEFPTLKSLPGLHFKRRVEPREPSEPEWTSPLTERQLYDDREEQKSGYDAPRRYGRPADPRRQEAPPSTSRKCPSPSNLEAPPPRFHRERLSPLHLKEPTDMSPLPRFESPNSEHSDDGPLDIPHSTPKPILMGPLRAGPIQSVHQHGDSPGNTPPHEGGHGLSRYSGPGHMGPSRPPLAVWREGGGPGCFEDQQFDGPHHPGPGRFEGGGPPHHVTERTTGPLPCEGPHIGQGPMRGGDGMGCFDGPRFGGPMGQQPPARFEAHQHFEGPGHFNNVAPGPMGFQQLRPLRFDPPSNQMGPMRVDGPGQPRPRFDPTGGAHQSGAPRLDFVPTQPGPPMFAPQQHNLQPPMQPMAPPVYDNTVPPQAALNVGSQWFPEHLHPQFPTGPNIQPAGPFNMQSAQFTPTVPGPQYNPAAPHMGPQQPVNQMSNLNQPFLPHNTGPFGQPTPQVPPQENQFTQFDVNDLLSKLVKGGIIKPVSQPDTTPAPSSESNSTTAVAPVVEEEEEEEEQEQEVEEEEEDLPDLTSFSIDNMKQRYESVVTKLYSGNQCCLCSMRFTAAQTDMYADHLDWHFRQNHAGKVASKKITHRRWYYSLTDWIEFEEIADLEERAKSQFFEKENEEEVQKTQAAAKEKEFQSVRATKDQVGESCEICQEPFETYWVEEEEDWFLKNAIRVDEKNFHPSCYEDYKKTSSYVDVTPSPSRLLSEHPLGAFVKTEEEEETSCEVATVKQEVKMEACAHSKEEVESHKGLPDCAPAEEDL